MTRDGFEKDQIQNYKYIPYQNVSVDEAAIAFCDCSSFRQYLPAMPIWHQSLGGL